MASNGIVNSLLILLNLFSSIVAEFQLKLSLGDLIHVFFDVVVAPVGDQFQGLQGAGRNLYQISYILPKAPTQRV